MASTEGHDTGHPPALAIIGMSGRFPGARNVEALWKNVSEGIKSIRMLTDAELRTAGVDPSLLQEPDYVRAGATVDQADLFDASFFGYAPREAEIMDPQHRLFLECCWEAMEDAAYDVLTYRGLIGVFGGCAISTYMLRNLLPNKEVVDLVGQMQVDVGNDRDSLASTVSYKLNLRGPGVAVQTFCSTSLVAVHLACQSLLSYESDIVLAGGVNIVFPQETGYLFEEGGILSPDGECRTFDTRGQGSVIGNGVGVVAIKRLDEALADGDHIYAVVRGSTINNDGSTRVSYTAPGVDGEANVISAALSYADIHPETISYMEAHGTATVLGDAVELAAMKKAFRRKTQKKGFCAIGSIKPNVGHLDRAAGVTGLIKTTLALHHRQIPPSLNFEEANPDVDLEHSPFYVNTTLQDWTTNGGPRRAGVSSFGLGGTNAHVILEEAPEPTLIPSTRDWHVLLLSAKTETALAAARNNLRAYIQAHPESALADIAYTLQVGRSAFNYRQVIVCVDQTDALRALSPSPSFVSQTLQSHQIHRDWPVVLSLPASTSYSLQGVQELYRQEDVFRRAIDQCCALVQSSQGDTLLPYFASMDAQRAWTELHNMGLSSLALFLIEYAQAQLLKHWGIQPTALLGYGQSECVAACLAGILSLEDALLLCGHRARLLASLPQDSSLDTLKAAFAEIVQGLTLHEPAIPSISNSTGTWITSSQALDPAYWVELLCLETPVTESIEHLFQENEQLFLEVGPGQVSGSFMPQTATEERTLTLLPVDPIHQSSLRHLFTTIGRMWLAGVTLNWSRFSTGEQRRRLSLPTYPFERKRYWIEAPGSGQQAEAAGENTSQRRPNVNDWFYVPGWQAGAPLVPGSAKEHAPYLIFTSRDGIGERVAAMLEQDHLSVVRVLAGEHFEQENDHTFSINPRQSADYHTLFRSLSASGKLPGTILHTWSVTKEQAADPSASETERFDHLQDLGFYSLIFLTQALNAGLYNKDMRILVASDDMQLVGSDTRVCAEKSPLLGACTVIGQENTNIICRSVDFSSTQPDEQTAQLLYAECTAHTSERVVAYRAGQRWIRTYEHKTLPALDSTTPIFRPRGVYLITGGLGDIGLVLAEHLARTAQARLILVGRRGLPAREEWQNWLESHDPQDITSRKIKKIQEIEAAGGEVQIYAGDVADEARMREILQQATATFGTLHGVFYTAGVTPDTAFYEIRAIGRREGEILFRPKVQGLYNLERLMEGQPLDFCLVFSSISAVLGGLGFAAYAAANVFVDAFVGRHNLHSETRWSSVGWDTWLVKADTHSGLGSTVAAFSMTPDEGFQAVAHAIHSNETILVNSTGDLHARIRQWVEMESLRQQQERERRTSPAQEDQELVTYGDFERKLVAIWQQILGLEQIGLNDNFFDLGGNSLIALQLIAKIKKTFRAQVSVITLFEAPTITSMLKFLVPQDLPTQKPQTDTLKQRREQARMAVGQHEIALIGMAGRFPGATTVAQFWKNLCDGVESISFFTEEELIEAGIDPERVRDPAYVKARPIIDGVEQFDAAFFGYSPREAELMDPQHRFFLECSWEALEHAGYDPTRYKGLVGVFGGANVSNYIRCAMVANPDLIDEVGGYQIAVSTDKDSLTTSVSYKLNLRGPSVAVQTFCSTSLVATHMASQSLAQGECDLALAGGVSINVPYKEGHHYEEGGMDSPDGHCRTFDAKAKGSMFGDGVGVVILKRLADALADGDTIYAVLKGSAMNNDGSLKVSYTAPSVAGQADVVSAALEKAGVSAENISYVEAHGTATELGDPIEVAALTKAFRTQTSLTNYCGLGSVKTNIGHLDRAAGVSGLIKTALALKHQLIPPSLHFETPNPEIDFAHSPFYVNTMLREWKQTNGTPRRAGLNSLGMGGTNVHIVLEEAPPQSPTAESTEPQLILLSARTATALEQATQNLQSWLQEQRTLPHAANLADIAYTLQVGRKVFEHRRILVCENLAELATKLESRQPNQVWSHVEKRTERPVVFLFPGVGEQYMGLGQDLYEQEQTFREIFDQCANQLQPLLGVDIRTFLVPKNAPAQEQTSAATKTLQALRRRDSATPLADLGPLGKTELAQPFIFAVEYALARLLMHWGIVPQAMMGYSLGEYVAACVAGVLSLPDALTLVVQRALLISRQEHGAMLTVMLSAEEVTPYLSTEIDLAVITGPHTCVLAGPDEAIERLETELTQREIATRRVGSTHAFHSHMLAPAQRPLNELAASLQFNPPQIPYISNVTGTWISGEQATDPHYWAQHMVQTVQFAAGLEQILHEPDWGLLEVGPGQTLGSFVKQHPACSREQMMLVQSTLPSRYDLQSASTALLTTLGKLWLIGVALDWERLANRKGGVQLRRIPLPTYPFERKRYWILPEKAGLSRRSGPEPEDMQNKRPHIADWFYLPSWKSSLPRMPRKRHLLAQEPACWLLFMDSCGVGEQLSTYLQDAHQDVITVTPGNGFIAHSPNAYSLLPTERTHYDTLFKELGKQKKVPQHIVYLWTVTSALQEIPLVPDLRSDFYSAMFIAQALGDQGIDSGNIFLVTNDLHSLSGEETVRPEKALLIGQCRVVPQEYPSMKCCNVDITFPPIDQTQAESMMQAFLGEITSEITDAVVALRGNRRWTQTFEPVQLPASTPNESRLRQNGVYMITGGLGGIGLGMAEYLAKRYHARLILVGRSGLPAREEWEQILATHDQQKGIARRIRQVMYLEKLGAEVLIEVADVADEDRMRQVVEHTLARFGTIHGVLHAAGVPGIGLMQLKTPDEFADVMAPKVQGTLILDRVLRDIPLDFLVLFSSINSTTGGGPGQVDYCAANAFLDVYAQRHFTEHGMTIAVDWGEWQWNGWEIGLEGYDPVVRTFFIENRKRIGISFEEGAEVLERILACALPHMVVSTQNFAAVIESSKNFTTAAVLERAREARQGQPMYERPTLGVEYVAPATELEQAIAQIWSELLGIEQIGVNDDFFELGGHSLLGTQLVSRLRRKFQIDLSLAVIFEASTIADLAVTIELILIEEIEQMEKVDA